MADVEAYRGGEPIAQSAGSGAAGYPAYLILENTIEADRIDGGVAATDTLRLMDIPAGMVVQDVVLQVITGEATVTVDVGDSTDPNGWVAAQAVATAGRYLGGGAYAAAGKLYAADTELIATPAAASLAAAKLRVVVVGVHTG